MSAAVGPFPSVGELIPHAGPMQLLTGVAAHDADCTTCDVEVSQSHLFRDEHGRVPVWVALEYMAQCAAVDGALRARAASEPLGRAWLVGARRLSFEVDHFECDQTLRVEVRREAGDHRRAAYACEIRDGVTGQRLAEGRLTVLGERAGDAGISGVFR